MNIKECVIPVYKGFEEYLEYYHSSKDNKIHDEK